MMKKFILIIALVASFGFIQNSGQAQNTDGNTIYLKNLQKNIVLNLKVK